MNDNDTHTPETTDAPKKSVARRLLYVLVRHALLAGFAFLCAALLFMLTIDYIVMPFYQRSGREITAPDLRGKTIGEAEAVIRGYQLSLEEEKEEFHNSYARDTIYLQIPLPGTKIKRGRNIRVFVSLGPRPITVPDVVGKSPRNARYAIQDAGLYVGDEAWIPSNDYLYGIVAGQRPAGGEDVPDTTGVVLFISNGRKVTNIIMPNLLNLSLSAARDTLSTQKFNPALLRIQREEQPDLLPDTVIEQYPDPGVPANTNDEVILIVSTPEEHENR